MFITFAFFNLLNWSMLWQWPFALIHFGQGRVAMKRLQAFLLTNTMRTNTSVECGRDDEPINRTIFPKNETKAIYLTNVTSKWTAGSNRDAGIYNSTLNIASGELCAIIGPVGSGISNCSFFYYIFRSLWAYFFCSMYGWYHSMSQDLILGQCLQNLTQNRFQFNQFLIKTNNTILSKNFRFFIF